MNQDGKSTATQPRLAVLANKRCLVGVVGFEVDNNSYYQADTFRLTLCLSMQPKETSWAFWSSQQDIEIEVFGGYPANAETFNPSDLVSLVVGDVDEVEIDPVRDEVVLTGRDLTSRFVDNKTVEKFANQTASEIATLLAFRRELVPVVTPTSVKAGTYYDIDKVDVADDRPEWDLLTYLAQCVGFTVYVKGRELHFEPPTDSTKLKSIALTWQQPDPSSKSPRLNAIRLNVSRNLTVARGIVVTVRSYNVKQKKGFTVTAQRARGRTGTQPASTVGAPQKYFFTIANKTPEEAQQFANQKLAEISQHEMNLTADVPGDPSITPRISLRLQGTGTDFDQLFFPASVVHSFDLEGGYRTAIRAKNSSPESTVSP